MIRKALLGGLLAAGLLLGTTAARAQVVVGDAGQSNSQSIGANQTGADVQNSLNNANSTQEVDASVVIGNVDQAGQQDISTTQDGGGTQNSTNNANNAQVLGSFLVVGDAAQGNRQTVRTKQNTSEGVQNSTNNLNNTQLISVDVIIGDRDQDNDQTSSTEQTQEATDSSGSTIVIGGIIEISVDDDLPSVSFPGLEIDPVGNDGSNSSITNINNSQIILGT